jgi:hypothetical protein
MTEYVYIYSKISDHKGLPDKCFVFKYVFLFPKYISEFNAGDFSLR